MAINLPLLPLLGQQPAGTTTPEDVERRRRMAEALLQQATAPQRNGHWTQALAQTLSGLVGGIQQSSAVRDEAAARAEATAQLSRLLGDDASVAPSAARDVGASGQTVTSYSPQRGGDAMEGGYAAARPGPDGQPVVRTLEDVRTGASPYVTVAGNPAYYGNKYTIPQVTYSVGGVPHTLNDVTAVVHDTGGAFKNAPEGRFDLPVGRDLSYADTNQGFKDVKFLPQNAQPTQGGMPPQAGGASPLPGMDARAAAMARMLLDPRVGPWLTEGQRAVAAQYLRPQSYSYQSLPDGTILRMDPRGGAPVPVYQAPVRPQFTKIGQDQYGNDQFGFVNPITQQITPAGVQGIPAAPTDASAVPPPPPGVDPKAWRKEYTENAVARAAPATPQQTTELRKEVQQLPSYKNYAQAAPIYSAMHETAGRNTRASDLNLVYGLGKIMDPGSVVREGEMVMVKNAANLPDWLVNTINSLSTGASGMSPQLRQQVLQEAYGRMQEYESMLNNDLDQYRGIAGRRGIDERDILPAMRKFQPWAPAPQPPSPAATATPAAPGAGAAAAPAAAGAGTGGWTDAGGGARIRVKPQQ